MGYLTHHFGPALLALGLTALPLAAQDAADIAEVERLAEAFERATETDDPTQTLPMFPPHYVTYMSESNGITEADYVAWLKDAAAQMEGIVDITSSDIDTDPITFSEIEEGTPYALLPTRNMIEIRDPEEPGFVSKVQEDSTTLAIKEDGAWHMIRLGSAGQQEAVIATYPFLQNLDLPAATTQVVE
ncbi:hypothetical protein ACMA5I_03670 [Paracoccaceae bacterium GXU_MW_L88]